MYYYEWWLNLRMILSTIDHDNCLLPYAANMLFFIVLTHFFCIVYVKIKIVYAP